MLFEVARCQKSYHHIPKCRIFMLLLTFLKFMLWTEAKGADRMQQNIKGKRKMNELK